jgi:hypothetical protein
VRKRFAVARCIFDVKVLLMGNLETAHK